MPNVLMNELNHSQSGMQINITEKQRCIQLQQGKYTVHLTGGFSLTKGNPVVHLSHKNIGSIRLKKTWPVRDFINGKRAIKLFEFDIVESGEYLFTIENGDQLEVKRSGLFVMNLLSQAVRKEEINFVITRIPF